MIEEHYYRSVQQQRISLRARVTLLAAACVAGAVALVSIGAYVTVYNNLYEQVDNTLTARAGSVVTDKRIAEIRSVRFPAAFLSLTDVQFDVIDVDGNSLLDVLELRQRKPPIGLEERRVAEGQKSSNLRTDGASDSRVLAVQYDQGVALVMAQPLKPTKDLLGGLAVVLIVIGGGGIVVAALAGTAVARGSLRPVARLTQATERVARTGDLRSIPVSGDDELARLTQSFNTMLGAVAEAQERQRRLVADAGHELRTPLTSLRTNLELLLAAEAPNAPSLSEKDKVEIHNDVRAQLDELTQLIGDLVELAREEAAHTTSSALT